MIENVIIKNFKSIRDLELPLTNLNVLIGSNGVGKSNFISFFEMAKAIFEQRFGSYTLDKGGIDNLLYRGRKISKEIYGLMDFNNTNAFFFTLKPAQSNKGYIENTGDYFNNRQEPDKDYFGLWHRTFWDSGVEESALITQKQWRATYLKTYLRSFTVYHFHDTSSSSPMRGQCEINDNSFLRDNGSNLAAYLYMLKQTDEKAFRLIEGTIHSIAPYFKRFNLRPDPVTPSKISLEWEEVNSDMYLNGYSFSDGTIRFIALAMGYVICAFQTGYFYGKAHGIDIREHGSGNAGATNTLRVLGKKAALFVFLIDALKGFVAVSLAAFSPC